MPNYHSEVIGAVKDQIDVNNKMFEDLAKRNANHKDEMEAHQKAINLNNDLYAVHIEANEKLKEIISKYGE